MQTFNIEAPAVKARSGDVLNNFAQGLPALDAGQRALAFCALLAALGDALPPETAQRLWEVLPADLLQPPPPRGEPARADPNAAASLVLETGRRLPRVFPYHACRIARSGLEALATSLDPELIADLVSGLPQRTRKLWPTAVWRRADDQERGPEPGSPGPRRPPV